MSACAAPLHYSAEPMEAWVVDAETKQPLEGVIVVAHWELRFGHAGGSSPVGQLMVMEATTGKDGKFVLPGWGPKIALASSLSNRAPQLLLFKSGYRYQSLWNDYTKSIEQLLQPVRNSDWNGKTVKMERFKGTQKEYSNHLGFLRGPLRFVEENCNWKITPLILIALDKERQIFRANKIDSGTYSLDTFDGLSANEIKKCGSPSDFFKEQKR
jgi:hypothetical protein